MKNISGMRSRLAARLKPGNRSRCTGDTDQAFEGIASTSRQQEDSAFMRMPPEIRCYILENLWEDAGAVQHIILKNGRYTSKKYIESRTSVYSQLTLVIHDLETLYNFTVSRRLPIINHIRDLNISMHLPVRRESKSKMSPEAISAMSRWRDCCQAMNRLPNLAAVDMWLDTAEPPWRAVLSEIPGPNANPFVFGGRLAGVLTVDLPVNPERPGAWQQVAEVEPRFSIRARGWPVFRASTEPTNRAAHSIIKLWDSAEPGAPQPPLVFGTHM